MFINYFAYICSYTHEHIKYKHTFIFILPYLLYLVSIQYISEFYLKPNNQFLNLGLYIILHYFFKSDLMYNFYKLIIILLSYIN